MSLKQYLIIMSIATGLSLAGFLLVLFFIDPNLSTMLGPLIFYLSFGAVILGTASVVGVLYQVYAKKSDEVVYRLALRSFRQGALLAVFGMLSMFLQSKHLLTWGTGVPLLLLLVLLEYGLSVSERRSL